MTKAEAQSDKFKVLPKELETNDTEATFAAKLKTLAKTQKDENKNAS